MDPDATSRLAARAEQYAAAFETVQRLLRETELGTVPPHVFAIEQQPIAALRSRSPELARAEQWRRQCRAALHATAELIALSPEGTALPEGGGEVLPELDKLIAIVQRAKEEGCSYVNGVFEPVGTDS